MIEVTPIILCGGVGTRLWPASRRDKPKPFLPLLGGRSLYQATLARVAARGFTQPIVVASEPHRFFVEEQAAATGVSASIVLEPMPKDSGPAALLGLLAAIEAGGDDARVIVLASDHVIRDAERFRQDVALAADAATANDRIVLFGIPPTAPSTDFGYIRPGVLDGAADVHRVERFHEKPDAGRAAAFVAEGWLWNSGMFVARARTLTDEYRRIDPGTHDAAERAFANGQSDLAFFRVEADAFAEAEARSLDHAVMERSDRLAVRRARFDWSDVGSWQALGEVLETDEGHAARMPDVVSREAEGNVVWGQGRQLIALAGVDDLIVAATDDAVLVARRGRPDLMRAVVADVEARSPQHVQRHAEGFRPWGHYRSLARGPGYQVKAIMVKPGGRLSLQHHEHRAEHWIVVRGTADVTIGDETRSVGENESVFIPIGTVHRLENRQTSELEIIEVQSGAYLEEDDIVRHDDLYHRD